MLPGGGGYCARCDVLVGREGLHVLKVVRDDGGGLVVDVESAPALMGCPACGVVAWGHGRVVVRLVDAPAMGRPVRIRWRKRRWVCPDPDCAVGTFVEQDENIAAPRSSVTRRACRWAIEQIRRAHASVNGIRRQLRIGWRTGVRVDPAAAGGLHMAVVTRLRMDPRTREYAARRTTQGRTPKRSAGA